MLHCGLSTVAQRSNDQDREHRRRCRGHWWRHSRLQVQILLDGCMRIIRVGTRSS
jgi:hypothetical protein